MIQRDMIMQRLGALSDQELIQILAAAGGMQEMPRQDMGSNGGFRDPDLAALNYDEGKDGIKGWSERKIIRQKDDRPNLSDAKNFIVEKEPVQNVLHMGDMPADNSPDAYMGSG